MSFTAANSIPGQADAAAARAALEQRFDRLLAQNGPALGRLAGSYARTTSDRDDLLQEIAMGIWRALPNFREECSERTFVFRIAHNRAIAYLMRNRSRAEITEADIEVTDPGPDPEAALVRDEGGQHLARAVTGLPLTYREVVVLVLEGLDYKEIGEIMGISESNVGARLTRARQMLRKIMEGNK
jgi:RNA polymerase sigma factor (sigma-70 family)